MTTDYIHVEDERQRITKKNEEAKKDGSLYGCLQEKVHVDDCFMWSHLR